MKKLLFLLVITASFCYSQEEKLSVFLDFDKLPTGEKITIYYNDEWRPLIKKDSASFYREITFKEKNRPQGRNTDYYINGVKQNVFYASYVGLDKQGIDSVFSQGPSTYYHENGNKSSFLIYINNKQEGEKTTFYKSGEIETKVDYINNLKQGEEIVYYKSGEVKYKLNWVDNLKQGEHIGYYKSGEIEYKLNYIDDLIQGEQIGYYQSGEIQFKRNYVDDLKQGERIGYYESGEIENKVNYIDNLIQGEQIGYYESGEVESKLNWIDDLIQGEQIGYYQSGEVNFKRNWIDGLRQGEQIYYKTGQTKDATSGLYIEGKIDYTKLWLDNKIKERRIALVIGNANYNKGTLENPVNDATLIAESLKKLDFEVLLHTNLATEDAMLDAIKDFGRKRKNYEIGFVYYAGHGVQLNNQNYLLPTKEVFEFEEDVEDNAVSVQRVLRYLEASREGQLNFVVLDACRDNPFESNWNKTRSLKGGGLAKTPPPQGSLIAYSTDHGQTAADGNGENSMYSKALASNLLVKGISIEQVFKNVRTEVLKLSKNKQSPVEESKLTGEVFYMNKKEEK